MSAIWWKLGSHGYLEPEDHEYSQQATNQYQGDLKPRIFPKSAVENIDLQAEIN